MTQNDFVLFSPNSIEKPTRLTFVGTRISLLRLQNHTFSSFAHVYGALASKLHHKFTIWCPTIPFLTPKWSQTSSASWPSLADPGWPARPPGPAGGSQAGPHLAGRWAAFREGNEKRAQEGAQRAGAGGAPPLLSPQVGYFVHKNSMVLSSTPPPIYIRIQWS